MPTEPCFEINPLASFYRVRSERSPEVSSRRHKASEEPVRRYEAKRKNSAHELFIEREAKQCDKGQRKAFSERLFFVSSHVVLRCDLVFTIQLTGRLNHLQTTAFSG